VTLQETLAAILQRLAALAGDADAPRVADLRDRLVADRFRVLLVGEAKRGKSTLGSALLGVPVLPSGVVPLTSVSTTVRRGQPEGVAVRLADGDRLDVPIPELARYVTESGNPRNRLGVVDVTVRLASTQLPEGVDLVDTPGAGSVFEHNTAEADAALESMDAAILVLTSDPPISASERSLLERVQRLSVYSVVGVNKADRLDEDERDQVCAFTREVIARVGGAPSALFVVSARDGLAARLRSDPVAWKASGAAALWDAVTAYLSDHRHDAFVHSLAGAAARVTAQLSDEAAVARAAEELRSRQRHDRIDAFQQRLTGLARRQAEAFAVARADVAQLRRELDASAERHGTESRRSVAAELWRLVGALGRSSACDLEDAGREALARLVTEQVDVWRDEQSTRLEGGLRRLCLRQQQILDEAIEDLRQAGREFLGVDLDSRAELIGLPEASRFFYALGPQIGWNEPLTTAVRRSLPGRWGRTRVRRMLAAETERLVDMHHGRARADFQTRLQEALRAVERTVLAAYQDRERRLTNALALSGQGEDPENHPRNGAGARLAELTEIARELDGVLGRTDV
jgi:hypothetical protein